MIHATHYNDRGEVDERRTFNSLDEFRAAVMTDLGWWDSDDVCQCEKCDEHFMAPETVLGGRTGRSTFCSDDCKLEADDDIMIGDREAAEQYAMYGNDYDSWYR